LCFEGRYDPCEWEGEMEPDPYFQPYQGCCSPWEPQDIWEREERFREETSWPGQKDDPFLDELFD
ncbi:MAG: hypothetical protein KDK65_04475, partial [Chlamydiia bacterium]|nr:hypothetical protein [Chlamydiia bacterium]